MTEKRFRLQTGSRLSNPSQSLPLRCITFFHQCLNVCLTVANCKTVMSNLRQSSPFFFKYCFCTPFRQRVNETLASLTLNLHRPAFFHMNNNQESVSESIKNQSCELIRQQRWYQSNLIKNHPYSFAHIYFNSSPGLYTYECGVKWMFSSFQDHAVTAEVHAGSR